MRTVRSLMPLVLIARMVHKIEQWLIAPNLNFLGMDQLKTICGISGCSGLQCPARLRLEGTLQQYFKFTCFKSGQMEAILPLLRGKDVFVRMATGSGKPLCMFLPPLAVSSTAMAVVISPLIGLLDQQVRTNWYEYKRDMFDMLLMVA